ncbi:aspartyl-phosphate phosphatase Spo0E family protein [Heyndrickxia ginsengihumi]|uniref:Aspartyl-phosphate phosphatase Spo0E family protein n=1 Tax=Heyndrickxia ginsengihumi TaxID=363870 RepID=A0A6M0PC04_9BACI|nr:aspartyl-phosphate phosphatase Spo0E family protein [Heyndrickxia ginsengihumi]MBE6185591.1 aspartyl-phosphate phosphatase Spo0E family protein [Bacillus sp. (in: firmicutes)]MCM3022752.1 aspartyl-phosphate phosphatase Spo0E family protein [Heyndrickxia ginsengihumi]NEY21719.1 aspartyl-phosphate phosphatase Spo0E family protein [Heyndrickxia ginsengihumi]
MDSKTLALIEEIEKKRLELTQLAASNGYVNEHVIRTSEHLDQLINQYYTLKKR